MSAEAAGQVLKTHGTAGERVLGGWKEQVLLPGMLLGLFKMSLMYIAVVSERKLIRTME